MITGQRGFDPAQVRKHAETMASQFEHHLQRMVSCGYRTTEDRNALLLGQHPRVVGLFVLNSSVQDEDCFNYVPSPAEVVDELCFGPGRARTTRKDCIAEEGKPRMTAADLLLQLVNALLQVPETYLVRCSVHR